MGGEIVSVLFTDLVGSTELLDRLGDDAAERVRQTHFGLLREAVRTRRGHEVKNLGDGLMVVFPSALDALDCAVAIQRKVRRHNEAGQDPALHVRVGIHIGEPIREEGDYFGTAVNVAKRLCDKAAADQILTSQLVVDLVGSRGGFTLRSIGPLELKGLAQPVLAAMLDWDAAASGHAEVVVEYRVLGPVGVGHADDGPTVPLASGHQRLLLACLLANAGHVVSADQLVDALWGENLPSDPQDALQSHISRLRHRLGPSTDIETTPAGYRFTAPDRLDAARFERLVDDARRTDDPAAALDAWDGALSLWRGHAYFDVADHPAIQTAAARLDRLRVEAAEARAETLIRLGRSPDALAAAEVLVAQEPLRERPVELQMRALAASGCAVDAVRAYEAFRRRLAEEVGLDPSPELRALEGEILRHERPSTGLPRATTSFVGRHAVLERVVDALGSSRFVTLTGPGGMGKTRLALETAHRQASAFRDGAVFCELGPVPDPAGVAFALAAGLGVRQLPNTTIEESLVEVLATRQLLWVVDNCEHVLDGVVPLLERVLRHCPGIRVLATSRERLAADGEAVVEIPPLEHEAEAVRLLCDRVESIRREFSPDVDQQAALMEIARRLDGLPLALELAAARVATMGPLEVARRLDDPFALLTRGRRSAPDRHRTLRATVEWSYALLDEAEQQVFERAAVFAGGFTLAAAEEVCVAEGGPARRDIADLVSALADKSMIVIDDRAPTTRYRLLETLRQFGRDRLAESGRLKAIEEVHARYYVRLAWEGDRELRGPGEAEWVRILQAEVANMRSAHAWTLRSDHRALAAELSAGLYWFGYWRNPEMMGWAVDLSDDDTETLGPNRDRILALAGTVAWRQGDLLRTKELAQRILASAGAGTGARYGWKLFGIAAIFEGRLADAADPFRRMADLSRRACDHYEAAHALGMLALTQSYAGNEEAAIASAGGVRVEAVRSGAPSALGYNAYVLGEILATSEPDHALAHLDRALALCDAVAAPFIHGIALVSATSLRVRHSDPGAAASALLDVIDQWDQAGHWRQQWTTLRHATELFGRIGDDEAAAVLLGAIDANDAINLYGADAERLSNLRAAVRARMGPAAENSMAEGRALQPPEVVTFARRRLALIAPHQVEA